MLKLLLPLLLISLAHAEEETVKKAEAAPVNDVVWPTKLPTQVYVIPVKVDPAAVAAAKKESDGGLPKGPLRKMMEGDEDDKKEKLKDLQTDITKSLIDKMREIGLPARAWTSPGAPPATRGPRHPTPRPPPPAPPSGPKPPAPDHRRWVPEPPALPTLTPDPWPRRPDPAAPPRPRRTPH